MDRTIHSTTKELGCKLYDQNGPKNATNARKPFKKFYKPLKTKKRGTHQKQTLSNKMAKRRRNTLKSLYIHIYMYLYSY